ncbi:hypothetical protein ACP4OV_004310 [Aristida adscensionis]
MEQEANSPSVRDGIAYLIGFATAFVVLSITLTLMLWSSPRFDSYSFALTGVDGFSQPAGGGGASSLPPAFNLSLYVKNTHFFEGNCFGHGQVTVSYGGVAMGEGRMPAGWCAGPRGTTEVKAVARGGDGVRRLSDGLRRRMEAEMRWGAMELDVEAELSRRDGDHYETRGPVLLRCKAVGPQVPPRPLQCKAFTDFQV